MQQHLQIAIKEQDALVLIIVNIVAVTLFVPNVMIIIYQIVLLLLQDAFWQLEDKHHAIQLIVEHVQALLNVVVVKQAIYLM